MNLQEFKKYFEQQTSYVLEKEESESYFFWIIENVLIKGKIDYILNSELIITENQLFDLKNIVERVKKSEPIQYIFEEAYFYGHRFFVNANVLIPRQETEQLVELIENNFSANEKLEIIDICTGSGCIAISLAKIFINSDVYAIDVDEKALEVAQNNNLLLQTNVQFETKDILKQDLNQKYDLIVSNPPYVREMEQVEMKANVLNYEPHLALFVADENPLIFYERIGKLALQSLKENGWLYFEINQYLGLESKKLLEEMGFGVVKIVKDFRNNDRILMAQKRLY